MNNPLAMLILAIICLIISGMALIGSKHMEEQKVAPSEYLGWRVRIFITALAGVIAGLLGALLFVSSLEALIREQTYRPIKEWCQNIDDTIYIDGRCYKNGIELQKGEK